MTTATHEKPSFLGSILRRAERGDTINFDSVFGPYIGKQLFLAVTPDYLKVIVSDEDPLVTFEKAKNAGHEDAVIMKAPKDRNWNLIL